VSINCGDFDRLVSVVGCVPTLEHGNDKTKTEHVQLIVPTLQRGNAVIEYDKFTILGAVAAMILPKDVGRYAYSKGLFVLAQSGGAVKILNDDAFKPHEW